MTRLLSIALMLLLFVTCPGQESVPAEFRSAIEQIDNSTAAALKNNPGGVTIGLVANANLVWTKSYGYADLEQKVPATQETIYRIGSITKQFTALMLLQLVEQGKVRLSDPVAKYVPEVNGISGQFPGAPPITLLQLAIHTSGLAVEPENKDSYMQGPVSQWEQILISALPHTKYEFEPGTRYSYSNIGYALLGLALSRAAHQSYVDYVQQRILKPLGMYHTAFEPAPWMRGNLAKGYHVEQGKVSTELSERQHRGRGYKVPNGALYTTVYDLARFMAFELGAGPESVLKHETLAENYQRIITADADLRDGYGIGFSVIRTGNLVILGHDGAVAGYSAMAFFDRRSKTGVIILHNATGDQFDAPGLLVQAVKTMAASQGAAK